MHFRWQSCRDRLGCETPAHAIALLAGDALSLVVASENGVGPTVFEASEAPRAMLEISAVSAD